MPMTPQSSSPIADDHGWLITPRALTSVATLVGLVYTLHAPVRYVLQVGANVDALSARVATLETEIDHQRGTIAAAEIALAEQRQRDADAVAAGSRGPASARAPGQGATSSHRPH